MSVTDPFIKDIKGCVQQFLKTHTNGDYIEDNNFYLILFCNTIEKIFDNGLTTLQNSLYFTKQLDSFTWLEEISREKSRILPFQYVNSVETVRECRGIQTNCGRFRLLVKQCLVKKCLHVPVEYLMLTKKTHTFYKENSIIGDEILSEIFLSVLLQISKFNFDLDLSNTFFLDFTWYIPDLVHLELVPCKSLGLSISFAADRAVIVAVDSNSVAAENRRIKLGDVLVKLNGIYINSSSKGRLNSIVRQSKGLPITLTIAKAYNSDKKEFFTPIKAMMKQLKFEFDIILKQYEDHSDAGTLPKKILSPGFEVIYIGSVNVGSNGNVKQVNKAMKKLLMFNKAIEVESDELVVIDKLRQTVMFEIGEIGIRVKDFETSNIIFDHSYMKISACGSLPLLLNHFAYIAGEENCDVANNFVCYVFEVKNEETAETILQSIGQGFRRTHFAV